MEKPDVPKIYLENEVLYYSNKKDAAKEKISHFIQHISIENKIHLKESLEQHKIWKEYDYFIYLKLLERKIDNPNIDAILLHVLDSLTSNIKEMVIISMEILKHIADKLPLEGLEMFIKLYFSIHDSNTPDMSFYGYLLPTIKILYGDPGLKILHDNCKNNLYKLQTICKYTKRNTLSAFISSELIESQHYDGRSVYEDVELKEMLFEAICKRREKVLAYETIEIDFILQNLSGIDPPAINYFKYFVSHLCITTNRDRNLSSDAFTRIQEKAFLLLAEDDTVKVKRGAKIYRDFYNCVVKSQYKTMYTLMPSDKYEERSSPTYQLLKCSEKLNISSSEWLKGIVALINDTNFHLFEEILTLHDCNQVLSKEKVWLFYKNLEDDYLEDKIDGLVKLLIGNWYKTKENRKELSLELLKDFNDLRTEILQEKLDYNLYRSLKMLLELVGDVSKEDGEVLKQSLINIIDFIVVERVLRTINVKLYERILVASLDLLLKLSQDISETEIYRILNYLEKGIFCNKRYAASASGLLYRKFIQTHYSKHRTVLDSYLQDVLKNNSKYDQKSSNMRRCLEKRILIHEFCLGVNGTDQKELAKMICSYITTEELDCNRLDAKEKDVRVYIFVVNGLIGDASLKQVTNEFVFPLLKFCLYGVDFYSGNFAVCNAIYTLYSTLVQRILPYHDNTKNMTLISLLQLEPTLFQHFLKITTASEHKRSIILLFLLLQRTNDEAPLILPNNKAQEVVRQLWSYISSENSQKCGFVEIDGAIKLWLNLIPLRNVPKQIEIVKNLGLTSQNLSLNLLNVKFKLLEGLARKLTFIKKHDTFKESLHRNILLRNDKKPRICLPLSLQSFPLKELTIKQGLKKILSRNATIYEKITAFEFFFDYFQEKRKFHIFIDKFLMLYIKTLFFECFTQGKSLEMFVMSLNTIAFCLDSCSFKETTCFKQETLFKHFPVDKIEVAPSLLAFLTIFGTKIGILIRNNDTISLIRNNLIEKYSKLAEHVDNFDQTEVESLLIAFKYIKHFKTEIMGKHQGDGIKQEVFLIAMKFLHSIILSECDYLLPHILDALDIDYYNNYLTADEVKRFLLSKMFLDRYFECKKAKFLACLKLVHWINVKTM